jgi:hypothetical protein
MKIDLNSNKCQWKHLAKQLCDFIKLFDSSKISELSVDEIYEFGIYDAPSKVTRRELLGKKSRRLQLGSEIFIRFHIRNTLSTSVNLKQIKLGYSMTREGEVSTDFGVA